MSEVTAVPLRPVGRGGVAALWIGIAVLLVVGAASAWLATARPVLMTLPPAAFMAQNGRHAGVRTTPTGLEYEVLKPGTGGHPTPRDVAFVEYRGTLLGGQQFDASKPNLPVPMPIAQVVPGFAEALTLMSRGARYRVWLPPELAYGDRAAGPIPPNSVLVFEITMYDFAPMPSAGPGSGMGGSAPPPM